MHGYYEWGDCVIYITGDTHGDFTRFSSRKFPDQKQMSRDDIAIICGDFGGIWKDSPKERYWLDWLNDKPFTTVFVDGNHENHERLRTEFQSQKFCEGQVRQIRSNILYLLRGEVYEIQGKKFFAFGGASSHDIRDGIIIPSDFKRKCDLNREIRQRWIDGQMFRVKGVSWWPEEIPSEEEMQHGIETLAAHNNEVDFVISHCLPQEVASIFSMGLYEPDRLTMYFNKLLHNGLKFTRWYCGHYHINRRIMGKFDVLYDDMQRIV